MSNSKFIQPADGIVVTKKTDNPSIQMEELIELGRQRVAAGEDADEVALDIAQWKVALEESEKE